MFSLSMTFYLFSMAFRSLGSVERGPTYFTCLLQIPVHHHSDIYSPILPLEEGHRIQAFSRYPYLVQQEPEGKSELLKETFFPALSEADLQDIRGIAYDDQIELPPITEREVLQAILETLPIKA